MNWKETREKLIVLGCEKDKLPPSWEWGIDLTGADLTGAYLRGADLRGADLTGAHLTGAYLRGADLRGADLTGAHLTGAYLTGAYLRGADLTGADLTVADLTVAYLTGADLTGADLTGAYLTGASINWNSHDTVAELLRRDAGNDVEKRKIAGLVLVSRDWCWKDFLQLDDPLRKWALDILAEYVKEGDNAPVILRRQAEKGQ